MNHLCVCSILHDRCHHRLPCYTGPAISPYQSPRRASPFSSSNRALIEDAEQVEIVNSAEHGEKLEPINIGDDDNHDGDDDYDGDSSLKNNHSSLADSPYQEPYSGYLPDWVSPGKRADIPLNIRVGVSFTRLRQASGSGCWLCATIFDGIRLKAESNALFPWHPVSEDNVMVRATAYGIFKVIWTSLQPGDLSFRALEISTEIFAANARDFREECRAIPYLLELRYPTSSTESFDFLKMNLERCTTQHNVCKVGKEMVLPLRILSIEYKAAKYSVNLQENKNPEHGEYLCLSHCWGVNNTALKTMKASLQAMKSNIPWKSLPKTFRDAIVITRKLGFRYLWIDSLCIIQDSVRDWELQSSRMGDIYNGAFATIFALYGNDSDSGCFSGQIEHHWSKVIFRRCPGDSAARSVSDGL
ncbi:HET-domain-containing protein [Mollisia scopiformis]|uniref:HET-domain-containing protein n=1 Tax=Mollisia scopiformis TaxID=149040 RepID=A0A194WWM2_MOLSC|nr:HET-domain-containing protein [Mollisia scopiformis]KUJ12376.1 HET-domain-containing protein [Mollisia scopiformis]